MNNAQIIAYIKTEFNPIQLATPDDTIEQMIVNAKRYWNTHSAFPLVRMFPLPSISSSTGGRIQLTPDFKQVIKCYPSTNPDWILGNYPLWSLLGITIIDNLTSDLIELSEAYRNYRYYMGTDFHFLFQKSDDAGVGPYLYLTNVPSGTYAMAVVGNKRIVSGEIELNISTLTNLSGTFECTPVQPLTLEMTDGVHTYTDDAGDGVLVSSLSGYSGTIDYTTGAWAVTGWAGSSTTGTASFVCDEEVKSDYILEWLLQYIKALVKMVEGNALRKTDAINIKNDGQQLYNEGNEEKVRLEERLAAEGRWACFARRF